MSSSDWSSDSSVSEAVEVSSALNNHMVSLLSQRTPSRVTQRRRRDSSSTERQPAAEETKAGTAVVEDSAPRKQTRIDLTGLLRSALQKSQDSVKSGGAAAVDDVAARIAETLRKCAGGAEVARAVTHALADPLNSQLREAVLSGSMTPEELVALDEVSLLNPRKREEQERLRLDRLDQHSVEYLEKLSLTKTNMFTCPACGSRECYANFRSTDFVKWQGDDQTPTLLRCCKCSHSFRQ